jgi:hypothetical protein
MSKIVATPEVIGEYLKKNKPTVEGPIDGNAFAIIAACRKAVDRHLRTDYDAKSVTEFKQWFFKQTTQGDYNNLLAVCSTYVDFDI